jgi:hypothetical protein
MSHDMSRIYRLAYHVNCKVNRFHEEGPSHAAAAANPKAA